MLIHESRRRKLPSLTSDELAGFNCTITRCGHHHSPSGLRRDSFAVRLLCWGQVWVVSTMQRGQGLFGREQVPAGSRSPVGGLGLPTQLLPPPAQVWGFLQIAAGLLSHTVPLVLAAASRSLTLLLADGTLQFPRGLENIRGCFP